MGNFQICINSDFSKQYFYKKEVELEVPIYETPTINSSLSTQPPDPLLGNQTGLLGTPTNSSITGYNVIEYQDITKYYFITKNPQRKRVPPSEIPQPNSLNWNLITSSADVEFIEKYVPFKCSETFTDVNGNFLLNADPRDVVPSSFPFLTPKVKISAPGYITKKIIPLKGDGSTLGDLGDIILIDQNRGLYQEKSKQKQSTQKEIKTTADSSARNAQTDTLIKSYSNIKQNLIPILLDLLAKFGMIKAQELLERGQSEILEYFADESNFCPSREELTILLKKKNNLVSVLNGLFIIIDTSTKVIGITGGVIELLSTAYQTLKLIPLPASTGVPFVPGLPVSIINNIEDFKLKFDKTIIDLRKLNSDISSLLTLIRDTLIQCIQYLNLLDQAMSFCYPDTPQAQAILNTTLAQLAQSAISQNQAIPIVQINGFIMDVETENTEKALKRKRAIAKNSENVILLKGEWSFSSIDQILIDELVFYIQQNNLKAY
jgi:hypothetical protein